MPHLDLELMPACSMQRVIMHWTAGAHKASTLDRAHYHVLIEANGAVVAGDHSIKANASRQEPRASHTRGCNTGSIGVAVCCMAGAREQPFDAGPFPMTQLQWTVMAEVVAELCHRYGIAPAPTSVLAHGEVQAVLGIAQLQKWDPLVLPWAPTEARSAVMDRFRSKVREHLATLSAAPLVVPPAPVAAPVVPVPLSANGALT
jgi:N-acetyl-anhydromuramyl-L-alanine amidase AmpD